MGVDYYNCDLCDEIYDNCDGYGGDCACKHSFCVDCFDDMKELYEYDEEEEELKQCKLCDEKELKKKRKNDIEKLINSLTATEKKQVIKRLQKD
jgi:hypothetical protein